MLCFWQLIVTGLGLCVRLARCLSTDCYSAHFDGGCSLHRPTGPRCTGATGPTTTATTTTVTDRHCNCGCTERCSTKHVILHVKLHIAHRAAQTARFAAWIVHCTHCLAPGVNHIHIGFQYFLSMQAYFRQPSNI